MLGTPLFGEFFPVACDRRPDWRAASRYGSSRELLALSDRKLAALDPVATSLLIAGDMPEVDRLDLPRYQQKVNRWASDFQNRCLPLWEREFHRAPQDFDNCLTLFRMGMVTQYLEQVVGMRFDPALIGEPLHDGADAEQAPRLAVLYTTPESVFLHGLIDTQLGSCANMAALQWAIGWRLGWPVSLCCLGAHLAVRWDDGRSVYTVEPSAAGCGAFAVHDDATCLPRLGLPTKAARCGSDLRALTPRETLAVLIGLRARVYENTHRFEAAERDYCLARSLFPNNRYLAYAQLQLSLQQSADYFEVNERCQLASVIKRNPRAAQTISQWRTGFHQGLAAAQHALLEAERSGATLSRNQLKAIAQREVNGVNKPAFRRHYDDAAQRFHAGYQSLSAATRSRLILKAAGRSLGAVSAFYLASAARRGFAGENPEQWTGFAGAYAGVSAELAQKELVESAVQGAARGFFNGIFDFENSQQRLRGRFDEYLPPSQRSSATRTPNR